MSLQPPATLAVLGRAARRRPDVAVACVVVAAVTSWAMYQETAQFHLHHRAVILVGEDFWNNTWRAVRGLLSGVDIYGPTSAVIPGVESAFPVAPHVPASLLWQAPFAALPIPVALYAFTLVSLAAIWAGVFILSRPAGPWAILGSTACGAFAILFGAGPQTLLLGQPTGFILLGLALVVQARRPWVAALGFMLAASTIQIGLPLAVMLIVLRGWPVVWRGAVMVAAWSLPPVALGIAMLGFSTFVRSYTWGGTSLLGPTAHRIDLGELLHRAGIQSTAVQVAAGVLVLALALLVLARLPARLRRIDYPPVLCLVIAVILLCTYHESYDMLLVGGAAVPATLLMRTRSVPVLAIFGLAGISAGLSGNDPVAAIVDPICLMAIAVLCAMEARRASALPGQDPGGSIDAVVAAAADAAG